MHPVRIMLLATALFAAAPAFADPVPLGEVRHAERVLQGARVVDVDGTFVGHIDQVSTGLFGSGATRIRVAFADIQQMGAKNVWLTPDVLTYDPARRLVITKLDLNRLHIMVKRHALNARGTRNSSPSGSFQDRLACICARTMEEPMILKTALLAGAAVAMMALPAFAQDPDDYNTNPTPAERAQTNPAQRRRRGAGRPRQRCGRYRASELRQRQRGLSPPSQSVQRRPRRL